MAVRSTMSALIARVRVLINDTSGTPTFTDQIIQDVMDEARADIRNMPLIAKPTYSGSTIQYLDHYSKMGGWEDDLVIKQYLTQVVTPSASEPIAGHFAFAASTLPPLYITGKIFDVYRSAADLLERLAAQWVLSYNVSVDGQSLQRGQAAIALQNLAKTYRRQQRAGTISTFRSDLASTAVQAGVGLAPTPLDFFADGSGH
jgi:hypothetical protein